MMVIGKQPLKKEKKSEESSENYIIIKSQMIK